MRTEMTIRQTGPGVFEWTLSAISDGLYTMLACGTTNEFSVIEGTHVTIIDEQSLLPL